MSDETYMCLDVNPKVVLTMSFNDENLGNARQESRQKWWIRETVPLQYVSSILLSSSHT